MKIKVGIVLTIVLVLCLVGYIISTQTQINADLTKEPEKDSVQVSPEEAGMAEEIDRQEPMYRVAAKTRSLTKPTIKTARGGG